MAQNQKDERYTPDASARSTREGIESIVVAIVLAFLFRAFEAEAFVIPTGSMAPTLKGRHKDVTCPSCDAPYRTGDSLEKGRGEITSTRCPICFYDYELNAENDVPTFKSSDISFTGDRIIVNKLAYEKPFGDPQRWDVIVFKYPNNAKQNYIKRLVGLPNETLTLFHGDVYVKDPNNEYRIVRKPPHKLRYMLQVVNDSRHISEFARSGYPASWAALNESSWMTDDFGSSFSCTATSSTEWITYRQYSPRFEDWGKLLNDKPVDLRPMLISDFYTYNEKRALNYPRLPRSHGDNWVGDLAVEAEVEIKSDKGALKLYLAEAGRHHDCVIDVATGKVTVSINDGAQLFDSGTAESTGTCGLKGPGTYKLRFANCDNELTLWINNRPCKFEQPAAYSVDANNELPTALDLEPVQLGAEGLALRVNRLRVLRDVYYVAVTDGDISEYDNPPRVDLREAFASPVQNTDLFKSRGKVTFALGDDQYFPMGDNSPMSKDARLWDGGVHWVDRDMLIGKAMLVYWPHPYHIKVPFMNWTIPCFPNFKNMKLIH